MARFGRAAILEQFVADGVRYMFGNPGTVEEGFLDELENVQGLQYVLALQESVAVAIADGYARATGGPALVQLHSGVGLGNAVGMLYQARRGHSPLIVIAGESGVRYESMDAQMAADLVAIARPVTKYATRVSDPASLLRVLRRAIRIAMAPPRGPVFVALPLDVLDALNDEPVLATVHPNTVVVPTAGLIDEAVDLLAGAQRPIILCGDGVAVSGGQQALMRVAHQLGADIWGVDYAEVNADAADPLFQGLTGHMFGEVSRAIVADADAVLVVGTYLFPEVFPTLTSPFAADAAVVHIDLDGYEIAKNHPVTLGLVADPKATLEALGDRLGERLTPDQRAAADRRRQAAAARKAPVAGGMHPDTSVAGVAGPSGSSGVLETFGRTLAELAPPDLVLFDEALTSSPALAKYLPAGPPGSWFLTRGGSLGVGIPGAIGIKLARPDRTVIGFTGDGGSMYTIQALATAARHGIGAKFVICNNHSYQLLNENLEHYWAERGIRPHAYPSSFSLSMPALDFVAIARGHGVAALRVDRPDQVEDAVKQMLASDEPFLIDLVIDAPTDAEER